MIDSCWQAGEAAETLSGLVSRRVAEVGAEGEAETELRRSWWAEVLWGWVEVTIWTWGSGAEASALGWRKGHWTRCGLCSQDTAEFRSTPELQDM